MTAELAPPQASRRHPGTAAVLALLWPGVGYLYAGRGSRGLLLLLLLPPVELGILLLAVLVPLPLICVAVPAALVLGLHLLFARGAARAARGFPVDRPLPLFSRWYSCVAAILLAAGPNALWAHGYRTTFVQAFKIPTGAMEPTIRIGDHLLVVKWAYGWHDPALGRLMSEAKHPERGDLVVFRFPEDRSAVFIKRCIGLPGETVEVRGTTVVVNGSPLTEPYAKFLKAEFSSDADPGMTDPRGTWGPQTVPVDMYFVLGDNRDNSRDSRYWGFVPQEDLLGRAVVVYWSYAATREEYRRTELAEWLKDALTVLGRTRWDRFGRLLE